MRKLTEAKFTEAEELQQNSGHFLILRIGFIFITLLILFISQVMWGQHLVSKGHAERLEVLKKFIDSSEKGEKGFGLNLPEDNIGEHKFLEKTIYPEDFAAFSPKQKRTFVETFYYGLGIDPPSDSKYFHSD